MGLFRKKPICDLDRKLKKYPKKERKKLKELYTEYQEGRVLKTNNTKNE